MGKPNLDNYVTVKERKAKFYSTFPEGRIIVEHIKIDTSEAVFKTYLYKNLEEQGLGMPLATGYAQEFKGIGGFANTYAWCENCEESSVGRALDNLGMTGNGKCSREEIIKVQQHETQERKFITDFVLKTFEKKKMEVTDEVISWLQTADIKALQQKYKMMKEEIKNED